MAARSAIPASKGMVPCFEQFIVRPGAESDQMGDRQALVLRCLGDCIGEYRLAGARTADDDEVLAARDKLRLDDLVHLVLACALDGGGSDGIYGCCTVSHGYLCFWKRLCPC